MSYEEDQETARERCSKPPFSTGFSPETTAHLIEAIASDKASRLRTLAKATVVMAVVPEWMRAEEVRAYFGIPQNQLVNLALKAGVAAKKLDPSLRTSAVIFKTADLRRAVEEMSDWRDWLEAERRKDSETKTETEKEDRT